VLDPGLAELAELPELDLDDPRAVPAAISAVLSVLNESITTISAAHATLSSAGPIFCSSFRERMKTDTGGLDAMAGLGREPLSLSDRQSERFDTGSRSERHARTSARLAAPVRRASMQAAEGRKPDEP
jgi:hypothetical protein